MSLRLALLLAVAFPAAATAGPLTVAVGESWAFTVEDGQPVRAHRVKASSRPARGEIKASLTAIAGTTLTITNNSATSYRFRAELVGAKSGGRTCALPANMSPALEYWPQRAKAVRLSDFQATSGPGACPPANK